MAKKALGKGLEALISMKEDLEPRLDAVSEEIDISLIDINKDQPRKRFDKEKLNELAQSIKENGIIQPLVLRKEPSGRYTIIAGERRYRAARIAKIKTVPAVFRDVNDRELLQLAIIENVQREDLDDIEEANAVHSLMESYSLTQEETAKVLGKSRSNIANTLRLLNLPDRIQQYVSEKKFSAGHARTLLSLRNEEDQLAAAEMIIEKELSVREAEAMAKNFYKKKDIKEKKKNIELEFAEKKLSDYLETKVSIKGSRNKGKILIEYYDRDQLDELFLKISKSDE